VLTEQEVSRSWHQLFSKPEITDEVVAKAEALIDELRAESPLRHRLSVELTELQIRSGRVEAPAPRTRRRKQVVK